MKKGITLFGFLLALVFLLGASSPERPSLSSCGKHLPVGSQYSVELDASWDRRPDSMGNQMAITLRNDVTGNAPESLSEELERFAQCARVAVGMRLDEGNS